MTEFLLFAAFVAQSVALLTIICYTATLSGKVRKMQGEIEKIIDVLMLMDASIERLKEKEGNE